MDSRASNSGTAEKERREELIKRLDAKIAEYEKRYPSSLSKEEQAQLEDHLEMAFRNQYREMLSLTAGATKIHEAGVCSSDDPTANRSGAANGESVS